MGPKYMLDTYNSLYLVDGVAHNPSNFGNFLLGAAGVSLGVHPMLLSIGAHANSLLFPQKNGYPSQFDSFDDQFSILSGALHAYQNLYPLVK